MPVPCHLQPRRKPDDPLRHPTPHGQGAQIYDKGAECTPAEIPEMLACAVMDYLEDSPYLGAIHAQVMTDRRCTEYMFLLKNNSLNMYRHMEWATRVEAQEHPAGPAPPPGKEEV